MQFAVLEFPCDDSRETGNGRGSKEVMHVQFDVEDVARTRDDLRGVERVPSRLKKVVMDAGLL